MLDTRARKYVISVLVWNVLTCGNMNTIDDLFVSLDLPSIYRDAHGWTYSRPSTNGDREVDYGLSNEELSQLLGNN